MLMNDITCPFCQKKFELSDAIKHEFEEKARNEEKVKLKAQFEKEKNQEIAALIKKTQADTEAKNKDKDKELEKTREEKIALEKKIQADKEERDKSEEKIKIAALKEAEEEVANRMKQKDIQLEQAKKTNAKLNRQLNQTSQQLQGEAMELNLEEKLIQTFKYDEFIPVPKGKEGGDLIQNVKNKFGKTGAIILWEFKQTSNWSKTWIPKLREDMRRVNANESIIVSEVLPDDVKVYEKIDGVWVTSTQYALYLATILREMGLRIAVAKAGAQHGDEKLKKIHDYILSPNFLHKIEKHKEQVAIAKKNLEDRNKADEKYYRNQRAFLDSIENNTSEMYFDLQEILPELPSLSDTEPELLEIDNEENQKTLV